jgi:hypothetical protein
MKESVVSEKKAGSTSAQRGKEAASLTKDGLGVADQPLMSIVQRAGCSGCVPPMQSLAGGMMQTPVAQRQAAAMSMQKARGNRFVQRMAVQAKLMIGLADNEYEKEADRVAEQVMSMSEPATLRKQAEEEKIQTKSLVQRVGLKSAEAGAELEQSILRSRGSGRQLADGVKNRMEKAFGVDFSSVRVHSDAQADRLSSSIQARAFTTGKDIFLGHGEYRPESFEGQRLLAHELTHVVQQTGRVMQQTARKYSMNRMGGARKMKSFHSNPRAVQISQRSMQIQLRGAPPITKANREPYVRASLQTILTKAETKSRLPAGLLAAPHNIDILAVGEVPANPISAFRLGSSDYNDIQLKRWDNWIKGVFKRVEAGADHLAKSLVHWKSVMHPPDPNLCVITSVELTGSDLHERGLGAAVVNFTKPNVNVGPFPNQTNVKVVIKPEERALEKEMLGSQPTSLAKRITALAGLDAAHEIPTIIMETHAKYGSLIKFIQGQQSQQFDEHAHRDDVMSEVIAFAFLAGLSDINKENVIWDAHGNPYLIDADNAMNQSMLTNPQAQHGFTAYNRAETDLDVNQIRASPITATRSLIITSMLAHADSFINAIRNALQGKRGRAVPIRTQIWANHLNYYIEFEKGKSQGQGTGRLGMVKFLASKVPAGGPNIGPGLQGETGTAHGGNKFQPNEEARQIKADYDQGRIPFYNYDYTTGHVIHNGKVIWHGQNIIDAMAILQAKFPNP